MVCASGEKEKENFVLLSDAPLSKSRNGGSLIICEESKLVSLSEESWCPLHFLLMKVCLPLRKHRSAVEARWAHNS